MGFLAWHVNIRIIHDMIQNYIYYWAYLQIISECQMTSKSQMLTLRVERIALT